MGWFEVDRDGLAKLLKRKGMEFILYELVQNAWDTRTSKVSVTMEPVEGRPLVKMLVEDDDPNGFSDLTHAFTLFAESSKKSDPTKRGRFNLGEKLVLAVCESAEILSTKGGFAFDKNGRRPVRNHLEKGSIFYCTLRMTRDELAQVVRAAKLLLPPVPTTLNGELIPVRTPLRTFEATLPTEAADEEGYLRKTTRKTTVRVYEPFEGVSRIYEMGIPVVETDLPWTVEVMQKIPLNSDRDNVTPAYARELAVLVLNEMHSSLSPDQAALPAIQEALADERVAAEAVDTVLTQQFGEKRAIFDPTDPEANRRLVAEGYTVISGGTFSKDAWKNIRGTGSTLPSGRIAPTPKPYSNDPDAKDARYVPEAEWTPGMSNLAAYAHELAWKLLGRSVDVHFERGRMTDRWVANYGGAQLTFNYDRLGKKWFDQGVTEAVNDLLIHELSHEYGGHLTDKFDDALSRLGAKMVSIALKDPDFFRKYGLK